jgi:hypothetical protein
MVIINPYSVCNGLPVPAVNNTYFPWMSISTNAANLAYNAATLSAGPFNGQAPNIMGWFLDLSVVRFQSTLSANNRSGAVMSTLFYEAPDGPWDLRGKGVVDLTVASLSPVQIDNNLQVTATLSMDECTHLRTINRWIPNECDLTGDPLSSGGLTSLTTYAFQVMYFYGLPASTNFGKLYIESGMSFNPTAANIGMFPTKIRGGYPSTHNFIHQCRKLGIPL